MEDHQHSTEVGATVLKQLLRLGRRKIPVKNVPAHTRNQETLLSYFCEI
jgi:hypothetical protein